MDFKLAELPSNPYSLGIILRFLSNHRPFAEFEFGATTKSVLFQLKANSYFVCIKNDHVVGYMGWVRSSEENCRAWMENGAPLLAHPDPTAIAVTVFAIDEKRFILPMIRYAKKREPGLTVFWKRYYQDGRVPSSKIVSVE